MPKAPPAHARLRIHRFGAMINLIATLALGWPGATQAVDRMPAAPPGRLETGAPSFVVYNSASLGLQSSPSNLLQLADGRILVLGAGELAIGDGVRWGAIRQADRQPDTALHMIAGDAAGRLFCPVEKGFAQIEFLEDGRWRFAQRASSPEASTQQTYATIDACRLGGHWYWSFPRGAVLQWDLTGPPRLVGRIAAIDYLFGLGEDLFVTDLTSGQLLRFPRAREPAETLVPASTAGIASAILVSTPFDATRLLVGTNSEGLALFDGHERTPFLNQGIFGRGASINGLCTTEGGFFAAAVDAFGVVFFDRQGRIVQTLGTELDHRLGRIRKLVNTGDGFIWALLSDGIARIEFPAPLSYFDALMKGSLAYVEPFRFEGDLWLQSGGRVLRGTYSDDNRLTGFVDDSPPAPFVFTLSVVTGRLLAMSGQGIYERTPAGWELVVPDLPSARIVTRSPRDGRWLYAATGELGWLDLSVRPYAVERQPIAGLGQNYGAIVDAQGRAWLELGINRVGRTGPLDGPLSLQFLDQRDGMRPGWAALARVGEHTLLNCDSQLLRFDEASGRFVNASGIFGPDVSVTDGTTRPRVDVHGNLWISGREAIHIFHHFDTPGRLRTERLPDGLLSYNFNDDDDGVVWLHVQRRSLTRYDPAMPRPPARPIRALITQVRLPGSDRTLSMPGDTLPPLLSTDNSLAVDFLAPGNTFGQSLTFEIMLEGQADRWVSTGIAGSAIFNRLKEGNYLLRVRPVVGTEPGEETHLAFLIRPPWFRTPLAYSVFGLLGVAVAAASVLLPARAARRKKLLLERLVAERTADLHEANARLANQVAQTARKADDLQSSEERYRLLSGELEQRVHQRTEELQRQVAATNTLNRALAESQNSLARSAAELQQANANLLTANHELESFSYSVSHDLRAPLRNIGGFIELLRRRLQGSLDQDCTHYVDVVVRETKRLSTLIDDLLAFSRIGRSEMKPQRVDLAGIVQDCRTELATDIGDRKIEWRIGRLPPVQGDRPLLRQVVANLLGNAVKFTGRRAEAVIEIGCHAEPQADGRFVFFVRDNGAGFDPEYSSKLFGVFQRLHGADDFEGTGIGLANVKRIITRHGGQIWAEGVVDRGATFSFTLKPATASAPHPVAAASPSGSA